MNFVKHIHPAKVPLKALEFKSTWALGGMCLVLVIMLAGSGTLMLFTYQPFPEFAYKSVQNLENQFIFGRMIRSMHYFCANLLVVLMAGHMARVFFTGGYYGKRQSNWIIGLSIFSLMLLSCFTGYLLPWDQTAFWAVTICINMFDYVPGGGFFKELIISCDGVGSKTLQLFYTLHTTLIPVTAGLFLIAHFWKIRKAKGVVTSDRQAVMVASYPNLLLREAVIALVLSAGLIIFASVYRVPLGDMANAGLSPNPAKAPWYFAGFQELLFHFHPFFAVFLIPSMIASLLIYLPLRQKDAPNQGIWFISKRAKKAAGAATLFAVILTPAMIIFDEYVLDLQQSLPKIPAIFSTGLIPFAFVIILIFLHHFGMKKKNTLSDAEAFQTSAVFLITVFIILTLTCIWLRGPGMSLIF